MSATKGISIKSVITLLLIMTMIAGMGETSFAGNIDSVPIVMGIGELLRHNLFKNRRFKR